ncbi:MAG: sigma-70 family RNA polymerase sigma factor [Phycisphaerales bacterium]|nr:MAG: sigma-70 family RNA polymerase sigma factor [Phycisphaerales bacterium]
MAEQQHTTADDEQLVRATLGGDISAFGTIVERHWNMVVGFALSRIDDPVEAEDIAQDSFLKAYSHLHTLRDPSRFAGWLSKIAIQQCSNTIRKSIRRRAALGGEPKQLECLDELPALSANPGLTQYQARFIRQTVRQLPEKSRNVIVMRFVAGLSAVQIAEQLGKRPGTVRVWLHRAYNMLRRDLAPLLEEVGP